MESGKSSKPRLLTGYLSAFGAIIAGALSASCVQSLQGAVPDFQLSVIRSIVQVILYMIGGKLVGAKFNVKKETIPGLIYLGVAYLAINVGTYGATTYLPLSEVMGIGTIATIVTAFLHSRLVFYKDITQCDIISSTVCVVGILLTAQPSWLFKQNTNYSNITSHSFEKNESELLHLMNDSGRSGTGAGQDVMALGYILSIIGGAGLGITVDIAGTILHGIEPIVQATYAASFSSIGSVACMFYLEDPVLMITISQSMFVSGHAVLAAITSFLTVQAAHCIPGPSLSVVFSFDVVSMLICQYTIMHSVMPGNYNWIEVLGCVIITVGASIPSILNILANKAKADELP